MILRNTNHPPHNLPPNRGEPAPISPASRRFLWVFSILMVVTAGAAFIFKLIEYIYQFYTNQDAVSGKSLSQTRHIFAIEPLLIYLIVAAGFACLFIWAYLSGHYRNVEGPKYRMLRMQREIDEAEAKAKP